MNYPIAIEPGDDTRAFGVVLPDLPGCFSAGDTLDEAISNTHDAISLWMQARAEQGEPPPLARSIEWHRQNEAFQGWVWAVVEVTGQSDEPV